ncbi:sodium-dependent transporter [candidate division KSB1 bacterium]|nr:sodium-dependent transporter [candidate division KSB1 bacterium]
MKTDHNDRGQWSSKFGFVLATSGSAIGLANIWAFPYRTGQNGGAAFVFVYLLCIAFICLPFLFAELALGRYKQKNVIGTIRAIRPNGPWLGLGILCLAAGIFILSFYAVIAGWSFGFIFKMLFNDGSPFPAFASSPLLNIGLLLIFLCLTMAVVHKGVQYGIERWSKILMPTLLVLMIALILHGLTLPGAGEGLKFFLNPDFSKIDGKVIMTAMGQAFFSLSLGIGGILTYGSYLSKKENIISAGISVAVLDTVIALMAGLMIFPALFSFGQAPNEGPALVFIILPEIFRQLPFGNIIGAGFFVMLTIAALTSAISMLEISIAYFVDEKNWPRKKIVWIVGAFIFILGIPSALSSGAVPALTSIGIFAGKSFLEIMIFLWFDIFPPLGAMLFCIFIGWVWGIDKAVAELAQGSPGFKQNFLGLPISGAKLWGFFIRYVCPLAIAIIWYNAI